MISAHNCKGGAKGGAKGVAIGVAIGVVVDPPPGLLDNKSSACRLVHGEKIPFGQNERRFFSRVRSNVSPVAPERSETTLW